MIVRGERYRDDENAVLAAFIETELPFLDFYTVCDWYGEIIPHLRPKDRALLGCNDRFFLLTVLLHRHDAINEWIFDRCREVETEPDGRLDLWAREHYKSTIITFAGIIQEVMCDPEITACIFSHQKENAQAFLKQIMQEFEANETLKESFPDVLWESPRKEAQRWALSSGIVVKRKSNPKEGTIEATGLVDGMPTGKHYALMVYDDVVTNKSVTNPEQVKRTTEAWELSDNLGAGEVRKWHIGTRYSFADSYSIMLERGALMPRIYAATENGRIDGKLVFMSPKRWAEKLRTQRSTLSAQMLQNPIAGKENMFRPEWFSRWEIRPQHLTVYIMVDPASSRKKGSDRTAIAVIGVDGRGNKFFLDGARHRMSLSERWEMLESLYVKWSSMRGVLHVKVGYEKYGMQADIEYMLERMRDDRARAQFSIDELNWPREGDHSKTARVGRLEPDVRLSKFFLPCVISTHLGSCYWHVDEATSRMVKPLAKGLTSGMKRMADAGLDHLICRPIKRLDEDRRPYDVTEALIEEMLFFPFAPKDDLVDAASRIYDMGIVIPDMFEDDDAKLLNARDWVDA